MQTSGNRQAFIAAFIEDSAIYILQGSALNTQATDRPFETLSVRKSLSCEHDGHRE